MPRISFNDFRSCELLNQAVVELAQRNGAQSVAMLSLTFRRSKMIGGGYSPREAHRQYVQLGYYLRKQFSDYIRVTHAFKKGQIHIHVVCAVKCLLDPALSESERIKRFAKERKVWRAIIRKHPVFGFLHFERLRKSVYALANYLGHWLKEQYRLPSYNALKRPFRWRGVKMWACSKGMGVNWKASLASQAFKCDALALAMTHGFKAKLLKAGPITDALWMKITAHLSGALGKHWSSHVTLWQWSQLQSAEQAKRDVIAKKEMAKLEAQMSIEIANGIKLMRRFKSSYAQKGKR